MLERTAVGLESCGLPRILSRRTASRRNRPHRQLSTAFWQHGASAIELASLLPPASLANQHEHSSSADAVSTEQLNLASSVFVLDFLYPNAARSLLRQLWADNSITRTGKRLDSLGTQRLFTSSGNRSTDKSADQRRRVTKAEFEALIRGEKSGEASVKPEKYKGNKRAPKKQSQRFDDSENFVADGASSNPTVEQDAVVEDQVVVEPRIEEYILLRIRRDPVAIIKAQDDAEAEIQQNSQGARGNATALSNFVQNPTNPNYDSAWNSFLRLSGPEQARYSARLIAYLSESSEITDYGRILAISSNIAEDDWTNKAQSAAVLSLIQADRTDDAIERLQSGLLRSGLSGGIEYLIAHGMLKGVWTAVVKPWLAHQEAEAKHGSNRVRPIDVGIFQQLPDLGLCYIDLEKQLRKNCVGFDFHASLPAESLQAFGKFRHRLALLALQQPCPASSARKVLANLNDPVQYNQYLLRVLNGWLVQKSISKEMLGLAISDIYRTYRKMVGVKPHHTLLDRMFDYFSEFQTDGHDVLLEDWRTHWGSFMTKRAYEKFLTRFARLGDVKAVLGLWERFMQQHPEMIHSNRGWHSLLNVYAQTANPRAVEAELSKMKEKYGIDPDTSSYNVLLKAYVRTDDYARVLVAFDRIRSMTTPDAWTYSHVMAMAGKKGDLDKTIDLFTELQKKKVHVIKQMALPISQAYCLNGRPKEALRALKQLAQHKISSTESWNELLGYIALKADFAHWTGVLAAMEALGVPPDGRTHQATLDVLVNTNQISEAYHYLIKLCKERKVAVTAQNFATVFRGAIRGEEWGLVRALQQRMHKRGVRMNFNIYVLLVEAAHEAKATSGHARKLATDLPKLLRAIATGMDVTTLGLTDIDIRPDQHALRDRLLQAATEDDEGYELQPKTDAGLVGEVDDEAEAHYGLRRPVPIETATLDVRRLREETREMGRAMRLLTEMEKYETADELIKTFLSIFPEYGDPQTPLPNDITSALMVMPYNERSFQEVHDIWDRCWAETIRVARKPQGGIYAANRYDLCRPIDPVIRSFREQSDGEGLLKLVQQMLYWGFKLSQSNWCLAIQYLAETGEVAWAMHYCEKYMMPAWRGWGDRRVNSDEKLEYNDTRVLRATPNLILGLQREWIQIQGLAAWNGPFSRLMQSSEEKYPRLYEAFATSELETKQMTNEWNFPAYTNFRKASKDFLARKRAPELWRMSVVLRGYLAQRWKRRTLSVPFRRRIVGRGYGSEPRAEFRDLSSDELQMLYEMLHVRLKEEQQLREARGTTRSMIAKRSHFVKLDDEATKEIRKILQSARYEGPDKKSPEVWVPPTELDDVHVEAASTLLQKSIAQAASVDKGSEAPHIDEWDSPVDARTLRVERAKMTRDMFRENRRDAEAMPKRDVSQ